jgi:hypothetical protein
MISLVISALVFGAVYLIIWALLPGGARTISAIAALRFKTSEPTDTTHVETDTACGATINTKPGVETSDAPESLAV